MAIRSLRFFLLFLLARHTVAIQVTPNSPCSSQCLDSSDTVSADIVCEDADFTSTTTGSRWKECMSCLQNSTYSKGDESDQAWFLYNLRYSFDSCVFAYPNGTGSGSNPCETSTSCGALKTALEYGSLNTTDTGTDEFGYCDADGGAVTGQYYDACLDCVSDAGDTNYVANALVALKAGCLQKPASTDLLGLSASVFSTSVIQIVDPSTLNKSSSSLSLSTAAIGGIAAGGAAVLLLVAVIIFFRCRKRRNSLRNGLTPRWARDKRRSSFSFKCRNILASPLSPKFFTDLPLVEEQQQQQQQPPYGSLDAQMSRTTLDRPAAEGRYFIETKPKPERHPYETSLDGWKAQNITSVQTSNTMDQAFPISDQWNNFNRGEKSLSKKAFMTIDTSEAKLAPPPAAHPSPKENHFDISPSSTQHSIRHYVPAEHGSPTLQGSNRGVQSKTTTISSQGSGYPNKRSPISSSPLMKYQPQQHGWPSARETQEPWFPPPPPPGPPPSSTKFARKVSPGTMRRGKRESGSPVESRQIQTWFPAPPQR